MGGRAFPGARRYTAIVIIRYSIHDTITVEEFQRVLRASGLGERRPVDDAERLAAMLAHADLLVTARVSGRLVGIARSVTDFAYCCYLSDLAVDAKFQHQGIGRRLVDLTQEALHPDAKLVLLGAPDAEGFYPRTGFERHGAAFARGAMQRAGAAE